MADNARPNTLDVAGTSRIGSASRLSWAERICRQVEIGREARQVRLVTLTG